MALVPTLHHELSSQTVKTPLLTLGNPFYMSSPGSSTKPNAEDISQSQIVTPMEPEPVQHVFERAPLTDINKSRQLTVTTLIILSNLVQEWLVEEPSASPCISKRLMPPGLPQAMGNIRRYLAALFLGAFVEHTDWKWFFAFIPCLGAFTFVPLWAFSPDEQTTGRNEKIDWIGSALGTTALILFNLQIEVSTVPEGSANDRSQAPSVGWSTPYEIALLITSVVLFALFIVWEHKTQHHIMPLDIFKAPSFAILVFVILLNYMAVVHHRLDPIRGYRGALYFGVAISVIALILDIAFVRRVKDERKGWLDEDMAEIELHQAATTGVQISSLEEGQAVVNPKG